MYDVCGLAISLSRCELTLSEGLDNLTTVGARQQEIPLIVRHLKNPKYKLPGTNWC